MSDFTLFLYAVSSILAALTSIKWSEFSPKRRWLLCVMIVLSILFSIWQTYVDRNKAQQAEMESTHVGILKSSKKLIFPPIHNRYLEIQIGNYGPVIGGNELKVFLRACKENMFSVVEEDGEIKISALIRNRSGNVVAEIVKNEWQINPNHSFDRNYNSDSLEVRDASGDVVLQVRVLHNRIQIQATLYDHQGNGVSFSQVYRDGWFGHIEILGVGHIEPEIKIKSIFKYPSRLHLGELSI